MTGGIKRKVSEIASETSQFSATECCTLFERPLLAPTVRVGSTRGAGRIVNYSCIAALACSPSLMSPSLTFIRGVVDGENGPSALYGLLYGHILQWALLDVAAGRAAAKLLVMDSSGRKMWFQIDSDCAVASAVIVVAPAFSCSAAAGASFCLCVSRMAAPGPGGCTHRIDVVADVNPRGAAWALQRVVDEDRNSSDSTMSNVLELQ